MIQRLSLTARLTLLFTSLSCMVLLALGWLIGSAIEQHFEEQDRHALNGKLELAQHIIERVKSEQDLQNLSGQLSDAVIGHHDLSMTVRDKQGHTLLQSDSVNFPEAQFNVNKQLGEGMLFSWDKDGESYRGLIGVFATQDAQFGPITVAVATDIAHHKVFMQMFLKTLWLFVFGAAALTGLLAWFAASRGLRPLRTMGERAADITASKLNQRLSLNAVPPELAELANNLNQMLARLEEAFQRLSDFSSDLAHELRTPISNLMTQTQVSLSQARDAQSYRSILESNAEEYSRLARMISDMLFLAKAEHGIQIVNAETVDIAHEVKALFEFYEALAEEKNITLVLETSPPDASYQVQGDRLMLRRALSNILSNAIRYTPSNNQITVALSADVNQLEIKISNPGDTIPPQHLARLFERFYRADFARQHADGEGTGLGLAIVQAIVKGHGGEISATSEDGVTCFNVVLVR